MKLRSIITLALILGIVNGCTSQKTEPVKSQHDLTGIQDITINGYGTLEVKQGDKESLAIDTDPSILAHIKVKKSGAALTIQVDDKKIPEPHPAITFRIQLKALSSLNTRGSFDIDLSRQKAEQLALSFTGSNRGVVEVMADRLSFSMTGAGTITAKGQVKKQEIELYGSSSYEAEQLQSSECTISAAGAVSAVLNCAQKIEGSATGASTITYIGKPVVQVKTSGASTLKKR